MVEVVLQVERRFLTYLQIPATYDNFYSIATRASTI